MAPKYTGPEAIVRSGWKPRTYTMHHKRRRPKSTRAGCLMCKRNKVAGQNKHCPWDFHRGFGKLRDEAHAAQDLRRQ